MSKQAQSGYIMVLTLMIIGISVILVTQLFNRASVHRSFVATITNQQKAKELALAGISIAQSQLYLEPKKPTQAPRPGQQPAQPQEDPNKKFLEEVLPVLNRWQIFELKKTVDGIRGKIELFISSEDGKININEIFDFKKKKFLGEGQPQGDYKKIMAELLKNIPEGTELAISLGNFLKNRGYKLNDVSELFNNSTWAKQFKDDLFLKKIQKQEDQKKKIYLTDLFTIYNNSPKINPWLLSNSLGQPLGLRSLEAIDKGERAEIIKNALKGFKKVANWQTEWNKTVRFIYGKNFNSLPKTINSIWNNQFEPTTFSVVSRATVRNVSQSLFAILTKQKKDAQTTYKIEKLYWI